MEAVMRELYEEVGVICTTKPILFNVYINNREKRDDYVILYVVKDFSQEEVNSLEILEKNGLSLMSFRKIFLLLQTVEFKNI